MRYIEPPALRLRPLTLILDKRHRRRKKTTAVPAWVFSYRVNVRLNLTSKRVVLTMI